MAKPEATVVTGGANGIGRAIVLRRRALGERVLVLDKERSGSEAGGESCRVDLEDIAAVCAAMAEITDSYHVTRIVNCAGVAHISSLEDLDIADFTRTMKVNLFAPTCIVRYCLPAMKEAAFGRIVNISSRSALGRGLRTAYASSKGALISATRVWALELAEHGVTVNAIGPGPIETALYRAANPADNPTTRDVEASIPH